MISYGRKLCATSDAHSRGFMSPASAIRRKVLRDTVNAFILAEKSRRYHRLAETNLIEWQNSSPNVFTDTCIFVHADDWGVVTQQLTQRFGQCFAVLNMANAFIPGGGYVEGAAAQEENMYRRSNCHFSITSADYDAKRDQYYPRMTRLLQGHTGYVYLDTQHPRICIRGPEDPEKPDLGYEWLANHEVFPFYEMRASAQDLRDGRSFDIHEAHRRIAAQFNTLQRHQIRHVVFGAFGCGAFLNPANEVAAIYRQELEQRLEHFDCVAFAIRSSHPERDTFTPFAEAMHSIGATLVNQAGSTI